MVLAARRVGTGGKRGAHIGWKPAEEIPESHFVVHHLILALSSTGEAQVLMCPGMARQLVTSSIHAAQYAWPWKCWVINAAFADVVSCYEEGGCCIVFLKSIKNCLGVQIWTVIEGKGNCPWGLAMEESTAAYLCSLVRSSVTGEFRE